MLHNRKKSLFLLLAAGIVIYLIWSQPFIAQYLKYPIKDRLIPGPRCEIPLQISAHDQNDNEIPDALDFVAGARQEVKDRTRYDGSYYQQGYPPEGRGACTDVIWRAFRRAGYDLRAMVDEDIQAVPAAYGPTGQNPDSCIDYRRVQNLQVFFQRHGQVLTTEIKPGDKDNLTNWQPGDIVVFARPQEHIALISDKRRRDGVPLIIHNAGPWASEVDYLQDWPTEIIYHFRFTE